MLLKLFLIVSLLCLALFDRLKAEELTEESGDGLVDTHIDPRYPYERNHVDDEDSEASGDKDDRGAVTVVTVAVNHRQPPVAVDEDEEPEYKTDEDEDKESEGNGGGGGIIFDEDEGQQVTMKADQGPKEPVAVQENSLITHPGVLAAIVIGGVLVVVCLVVFFVLIVCCVRKKDEGTYDLDDAMKEKLKYVAYTKAETASDKEFFA